MPSADNMLERIIQKADHYSSGIDRDKQEGTGWKDAAEEEKLRTQGGGGMGIGGN